MTITMTTADAYVHELTVFANLAISGRSLTVTGLGRVNGHLSAKRLVHARRLRGGARRWWRTTRRRISPA